MYLPGPVVRDKSGSFHKFLCELPCVDSHKVPLIPVAVAWRQPLGDCQDEHAGLDKEYIYTYSHISRDKPLKPLKWVGATRRDLRAFPAGVRRHIGQALFAAQRGEEYSSVKALKGFGSRSVLEIVAMDQSGTYRAVYTIRFLDVIYVLHAFQKKSKTGIATPQKDLDLIRHRLAAAEQDYATREN